MRLQKLLGCLCVGTVVLLLLTFPRSQVSENAKQGKVVFIFGLGGSGTRAVTRLYESWGCKIDFFKLDEALDNSLVHKLNPFTFPIMNKTRSTDYTFSSIPTDLLPDIERRMGQIMNVIHNVSHTNDCVVVKWPRLIYLFPILRHYFPESKFIHVVRDARDMMFSTNELQYHEFQKYLLTPHERGLSDELRKVRFWFLLNFQTKHWFQKHVPKEDYALLNIESLVLEKDEQVYQELWRTVFESIPPENLSDNDIFQVAIGMRKNYNTTKYGKYKYVTTDEEKQIVSDVQQMFQTELSEFGYDVELT